MASCLTALRRRASRLDSIVVAVLLVLFDDAEVSVVVAAETRYGSINLVPSRISEHVGATKPGRKCSNSSFPCFPFVVFDKAFFLIRVDLRLSKYILIMLVRSMLLLEPSSSAPPASCFRALSCSVALGFSMVIRCLSSFSAAATLLVSMAGRRCTDKVNDINDKMMI